MLNTSYEFERLIADNSTVRVKASITFADGTVLNLVGDDFMSGGVSFEDAVSSGDSFDVGAAVIGQCTLTLNNYDERFSQYDFTDAKIEPYVGVELSSGTVEWLKKGVFWTEQPSAYPSTITLTALDNMSKFERPYSDVVTRYPATLRTIVQDVCGVCGVTLANANFANRDYSVPIRPDDGALTCLEIIAAAAQCAGCWARMDNRGRLVLDWYDTAGFEGESWLDGGAYDEGAAPYASGDVAEGGSFTDYRSGTQYEGGSFENRGYALVHGISTSTIITDDVVITGLHVTALDGESDGETIGGETSLFGSEGYVLAIADNPLIPYGKASEVASRVGQRVVGMRFRPFDVSAIGNPAYEAGDPILIIDAKQNTYRSYITSLRYKAGSYESFSCSAETPSRNSAAGYSASTKAMVALRKEIGRETSARKKALEDLAGSLADNNGLYMTTEEGASGGTVYYMHDKPSLGESKVVWKLTADAIGISTDGGKTYPYGLDVDGNAILDRIYAIGIDADYITAGALTIRKGDKVMFNADIDTGDVYVNADSIEMGAKSFPQIVADMKPHFAYCYTAGDVQTKEVITDSFDLEQGTLLCVVFFYANAVSLPTLSVNGGTAYPILLNYNYMTDSSNYWGDRATVALSFNGSYWNIVDAGTYSRIKASGDSILMTVANSYATLDGVATTYATKSELEMTKESIELSVRSDRTWFATCSTVATESAKYAVCTGFTLHTGVTVMVRFFYANAASSPTLNVNGTGAYSILMNGYYPSGTYAWKANDYLTLVFDGSCWKMLDGASYAGIRITEGKIDMKVSKGDVTSQLLMEDDKIALSANRLSWTSDGSSMDEYGNVTFNGEFAVNSKTSTDTKRVRVSNAAIMFNAGSTALGTIQASTQNLSIIAPKIYESGAVSTYNPTFGYTGTGVNGWVTIGGTSVYLVNGRICSVG